MKLTNTLVSRGLTALKIDQAVENTEKVLFQVINNAGKNVTNAQAMKGNASTLAADLDVLYGFQKEFEAFEKEAKKAADEIEKKAAAQRKADEAAAAKPKSEAAKAVKPTDDAEAKSSVSPTNGVG